MVFATPKTDIASEMPIDEACVSIVSVVLLMDSGISVKTRLITGRKSTAAPEPGARMSTIVVTMLPTLDALQPAEVEALIETCAADERTLSKLKRPRKPSWAKPVSWTRTGGPLETESDPQKPTEKIMRLTVALPENELCVIVPETCTGPIGIGRGSGPL